MTNENTPPIAAESDQFYRLIATFGDLVEADERQSVGEVLAIARAHRFDFLPVRAAANGHIVGLLDARLKGEAEERQVGSVMKALGPDTLIGG